MLLTPHALVGGVIGTSTDNLSLIIILAFLSHFVLDMLPHTDWGMWHDYKEFRHLSTRDYTLVFLDIIGVLILTSIVWDNHDRNINILFGVFFAILVDLIDNVPFWKGYFRKLPVFKEIHKLHMLIHAKIQKKYWVWGVITQLIIILITLIILTHKL